MCERVCAHANAVCVCVCVYVCMCVHVCERLFLVRVCKGASHTTELQRVCVRGWGGGERDILNTIFPPVLSDLTHLSSNLVPSKKLCDERRENTFSLLKFLGTHSLPVLLSHTSLLEYRPIEKTLY